MSNRDVFIEFSDDDHYIRLLFEDQSKENSEPYTSRKYRLEHNIGTEPPLSGLRYVEAMLLYVGLISELVEIHTDNDGPYSYSKEQFSALVNFNAQKDSFKLNEVLSSSLEKEFKNLKF